VVDGCNDIRRVDLSTIDIICSSEIFGFIVMAGWVFGHCGFWFVFDVVIFDRFVCGRFTDHNISFIP